MRSDVVFAWIDCLDCFGTLAEVGLAFGLNKSIIIGGPEEYRDLWFVYEMSAFNFLKCQRPSEMLKVLV